MAVVAAGRTQAATPANQASAGTLAGWVERAQQAQRAGDWHTAEAAWRQVLAMKPAAAVWGNLGNVLKHEGRAQESIHAFREGIKLQPSLSGLQLDLALVYFTQRDYGHAIPPLQEFLKSNPGNLQGLELLGISQLNHREFRQAAVTLEHAERVMGTPNVALLYSLASAQTMAGQTAAAQQTLTLMLQLGSDSAALHLLLGEAEANESHNQQALDEFQKAVEIDPRLPSVHLQMGLVQLKSRNYPAAIQQFSSELQLNAKCADCYFERGAAEFMQHQDEQASRDLSASIRLSPRNHDAWYYQARLELRNGQQEQAVASLRKAIAADARQPASHYLLGRTLMALGEQPEGKRELAMADSLHQQEDHRNDEAFQQDFRRVMQGSATQDLH